MISVARPARARRISAGIATARNHLSMSRASSLANTESLSDRETDATPRRRNILLPVGAFIGMIVLSLLVLDVYPSLVQRFRVEPNELALQTPYIARHIAATRDAYGLNRVVVRNFAPQPAVSSAAESPIGASAAMWEAGITRRNRTGGLKLRPLLATTRRTLVVVGALHLCGPGSLEACLGVKFRPA